MTTNDRLETWWSSLDEVGRRHAHSCVRSGSPDQRFLDGLFDARIGLTRSGWAAGGSNGGHIPRAIEKFVEARPLP
jgi:hypothetical protein